MYGNYPTGASDAAAGGFGLLIFACWGIFMLVGLLLFILNIWMLVDALQRQEYEFPGSTGSSKTLWIVLLAVGIFIGLGWIVAAVYYFMVFRAVKRGSVAAPAAQPGPPVPAAYAPTAPPMPPAYVPPAPPMPPEPPLPPEVPSPEAPSAPEVPPAPPVPPKQ